jgi:hypothetical protein
MDIETLFTVINLALQGLFFIAVGIITILTYIQAKDTILQPMRTELFKIQMDELSHVLKLFIGQSELALREKFDFEKLLMVNAISLLDNYASMFFDLEFDKDKRPYNNNECPSSIVTREFMEKNFELAEDPIESESHETKTEKPDPRVRAALWQEYQYGITKIPKQYLDMQDELKRVLESPVLPSKCAKLIEEYISIVEENALEISKVLTECAKELPSKYPSIEKLKNASSMWISNKYNDKFKELKPKADEIIVSIRTHWAIDELKLKK